MSKPLREIIYERAVLSYENPDGLDKYYKVVVTKEVNGYALWAGLVDGTHISLPREEDHFDKFFLGEFSREDALEEAAHKSAWATTLNEVDNPRQAVDSGVEHGEGEPVSAPTEAGQKPKPICLVCGSVHVQNHDGLWYCDEHRYRAVMSPEPAPQLICPQDIFADKYFGALPGIRCYEENCDWTPATRTCTQHCQNAPVIGEPNMAELMAELNPHERFNPPNNLTMSERLAELKKKDTYIGIGL